MKEVLNEITQGLLLRHVCIFHVLVGGTGRRLSSAGSYPARGRHLGSVLRVHNLDMEAIPLSRSTNSTSTTERIITTMANRKKRSRRKKGSSPSTPILTYTVTVAHEPGSECDSCAMPRPVLIEQEGGAWVCEICLGDVSLTDFWRASLITAMPYGLDSE